MTEPLSSVAVLLADPTRAAMLQALTDGRAYASGELAHIAHVAPSTASEHLGRLVDGELVTVVPQGRHRYYKLASPDVAHAIETLQAFAPPSPAPRIRHPHALRFARTCYDHLAGTVGVALLAAMERNGQVAVHPDHIDLTNFGEATLDRLDIQAVDLRRLRRSFARPCLDWTERQYHLAGSLGNALLDTMLTHNWLAAKPPPRALRITKAGRQGLLEIFQLDVASLAPYGTS